MSTTTNATIDIASSITRQRNDSELVADRGGSEPVRRCDANL
jgi:hypothetical protein